MKNKLLKITGLCLLCTSAMLMMAACGQKTGTISEYLESGDRVIGYAVMYAENGIGKDSLTDEVYVFEGDKLTWYNGIYLSCGKIASMTDDEVIEYCKKDAGYSDTETYDDYRLAVYTDSTGNNVYSEAIQVDDGSGNYEYLSYTDQFYVGSKYEVYDSYYTALVMPNAIGRNASIVFKDAPDLELDSKESEDVIVDP